MAIEGPTDFKGKKVLLTAYGTDESSESPAIVDYLKSQEAAKITTFYWGGDKIKKQIPTDVESIEVEFAGDIDQTIVDDFDYVFRHQTVPPAQLENTSNVTTSTNVFFEKCPAPIIGVTGTKGKGTTCSLVAKYLQQAGNKVHLVGNIGKPAIGELSKISPDDIVVFELSSFQLWDLNYSPHIAVVLMVEPDHLDVHYDLEDYINAKSNIAANQLVVDKLYFLPGNSNSQTIAQQGHGDKQPFISPQTVYFDDESLYLKDQIICSLSEIKLLGKHNLQNICAAISACLEYTEDLTVFAKVLGEFSGLDHRLQLARELDGVKYIDDSISTIPSTAIAAINAFEQPKIIILGGSDKGLDFTELTDVVANSNVKYVITLGPTGETIRLSLVSKNFTKLQSASSMNEAVKIANQKAVDGDVVLLSPGSASFGMFENYKDRGDQFASEVNKL